MKKKDGTGEKINLDLFSSRACSSRHDHGHAPKDGKRINVNPKRIVDRIKFHVGKASCAINQILSARKHHGSVQSQAAPKHDGIQEIRSREKLDKKLFFKKKKKQKTNTTKETIDPREAPKMRPAPIERGPVIDRYALKEICEQQSRCKKKHTGRKT